MTFIKRQGQHLDNFQFADKSNVFIPEIPSKPRKQWVKLKYLPKKVDNQNNHANPIQGGINPEDNHAVAGINVDEVAVIAEKHLGATNVLNA